MREEKKEIPTDEEETQLAATELFRREDDVSGEKTEPDEDKTPADVSKKAVFAPETPEKTAETTEILRQADGVTIEIYDTLISEAENADQIKEIIQDLNSILGIRESKPCRHPCKHLDSLGSESPKTTNKVFIFRTVERGKILESVYKPARGEEAGVTRIGVEAGSFYKREWLSCMVDRALGLGIVPPTVLRREDDGIGSVQAWVYEAVPARLASERQPDEEDLVKLALLDYLTGNQDRHTNNYLIDKKGRLKAIDNGVSFGVSLCDEKGREVISALETKSRPLEKIKDVSADVQLPVIKTHLKKLLDSPGKKEVLKKAFDVALGENSDEVWAAFIKRAEEVLANGKLPEDHDFKVATARINYGFGQEYLATLSQGRKKIEEAA